MVDDQCDEVMIKQVSDIEETSFDNGILLKTCVDCGTTKTPLWRGGPSGPKSLCNACGIRSRKKRRAMIGIKKEDKKQKKSIMIKQNNQQINNISIIGSEESSSKYDEIKLKNNKLLDISGKQRKKKKQLGEIEQAAFLLMALSRTN